MDVLNKYLVAVRGDNIVVLNPSMKEMTRNEALVFAAWLVVIAEDSHHKFSNALSAVKNS